MSGYDTSDPEQVESRKIEAKRADQGRLNGLRKLMADQDGRTWMWALLEQSNPLVNPFAGQSANVTAFNCGAKVVGVQILDELLTHCREDYFKMVDEAKETK